VSRWYALHQSKCKFAENLVAPEAVAMRAQISLERRVMSAQGATAFRSQWGQAEGNGAKSLIIESSMLDFPSMARPWTVSRLVRAHEDARKQ
jgi:hypothetical protein